MNTATTSVQQVEIDDFDSWLNAPGADNIVTPSDEEKKDKAPAKPNFLSNDPVDLTFLDKKDEEDKTSDDDKSGDQDKKTDDQKDKSDNGSDVKIDDIIKDIENTDEEPEEEKSKGGRPKKDKSALVDFFKEQIEAKEMFAFDDYDETKQTLDEYLGSLSEKDLKDLYKANVDHLKEEISQKVPEEFFESLPQELQYAAKYVADGGTDLKGLFQALAHVEQTRELDPSKDEDQEHIVRQYLAATGFGTEEEIEEEITTWKDINLLAKKANQFKPKLDKMQEEIVAQRVAEQELKKKQQQEASKKYVDNVFEALRPGEINGLKLDKTTQAKLYSGLTQPQYSSISGRPTNLLGHLLEKYQFVEPNYSLIAEALWLLSDPDEYRASLTKSGKNAAIADTVRQLKTEQSRKSASSQFDDDERGSSKPKKISRATPTNFFKR